MSLCLLAIFKNEAEILKEWLDHYIRQGVEKFLLINNNSSDNFLNILQSYPSNLIFLKTDNRKGIQHKLYNELFFKECKKFEWTMVVDLDEFVYARNGFKTIPDFLNSLEKNIAQVKIPWKMFGSNGFNTLDKKQPKSVVQNFTKRRLYNDRVINCKSIVRSSCLTELGIHSNYYNSGFSIASNYKKTVLRNINDMEISEKILEESCLHLNHYAIQSLEWFLRIKATRGNCDNVGENIRNESYFKSYDNNEFLDDELEIISKTVT